MSCIFFMLYISSKSSSTVSPPLFIHMAKHPYSCTYTQYSVKQSTLQVIHLSMCKFYCLRSVFCSRVCFFPTRHYTVKNVWNSWIFLPYLSDTGKNLCWHGIFVLFKERNFLHCCLFGPWIRGPRMGKKSRSGSRIRILIFFTHPGSRPGSKRPHCFFCISE